VCRSSSQDDRLLGFYNNGLYRVMAVDAHDARLVTVADALGDEQTITIHLEEVDGEQIPYQAIPFRFGYCLTAHTAQGGEWPTVYISRPELMKYVSTARTPERQGERAQWTYTAITRAKDTLVFLTHHTFERTTQMPPKSGPLSTPMLPAPLAETPALLPATEPVTDAPDDVADPPVPPEALRMPQDASIPPGGAPRKGEAPDADWAAHEAQIHAFLEHFQHTVRDLVTEEIAALRGSLVQDAKSLDAHHDKILAFLKDWAQQVGTASEHAQYQLSHTLEKCATEGLPVLSPPYQAVVQAVSPQGYPITLTMTKTGVTALVEEVERLLPWLQKQGYGVAVPQEAAL
jgi:hypothetical protein